MESIEKNGKKIALIGTGPASLTVALDLMPLGYEVHLFDDQLKAGGFVRTQVPSFRLPEKLLDEEINLILDMGVVTHFGQYVNSLKLILEQDFDAVFVGTGAPKGRDLELKGRIGGKDNIDIGIEWLAAVLYRHIESIGKKVLVLGGGNTAMDCCRTARRLGGEDIKVVVRSPRAEMKASAWEIDDAVKEDIEIIDNHVPLEFVVKDGKLQSPSTSTAAMKPDAVSTVTCIQYSSPSPVSSVTAVLMPAPSLVLILLKTEMRLHCVHLLPSRQTFQPSHFISQHRSPQDASWSRMKMSVSTAVSVPTGAPLHRGKWLNLSTKF